MAEKDKNNDSKAESKKDSKTESKGGSSYQPISDKQRFRYIGFEVYPGTPKDLFKNEKEKETYYERVRERDKKGETVRDNSTLVEERVSMTERVVLTVACLIILGSLWLPWYSGYTEVTEGDGTGAFDDMRDTLVVDTLNPVGSDTLDAAAAWDPDVGEAAPTNQAEAGNVAAGTEGENDTTAQAGAEAEIADTDEEIITGGIVRKRIVRDYDNVNWLQTLGILGDALGYIFASSFTLILSGILLLVYMLMTLVLPVFMLYVLFGTKAKGDDYALRLKKLLKVNWIPVLRLFVVFVLSFIGGNYGFDAPSLYDSLGEDYGIATFANTARWGMFVSMVMFILLAVKAIEI